MSGLRDQSPPNLAPQLRNIECIMYACLFLQIYSYACIYSQTSSQHHHSFVPLHACYCNQYMYVLCREKVYSSCTQHGATILPLPSSSTCHSLPSPRRSDTVCDILWLPRPHPIRYQVSDMHILPGELLDRAILYPCSTQKTKHHTKVKTRGYKMGCGSKYNKIKWKLKL